MKGWQPIRRQNERVTINQKKRWGVKSWYASQSHDMIVTMEPMRGNVITWSLPTNQRRECVNRWGRRELWLSMTRNVNYSTTIMSRNIFNQESNPVFTRGVRRVQHVKEWGGECSMCRSWYWDWSLLNASWKCFKNCLNDNCSRPSQRSVHPGHDF